MKPIKFKFSLLPGDLINTLAGVKKVCEDNKTTAEIYLGLDMEWQMTELVSKGRESNVTLTEETLIKFRPLLMSQPYISKVESFQEAFPEYYKEWCDAFKKMPTDRNYAGKWFMSHNWGIVDLDKHHLMPISMPYGNIYRWNFFCYPDMTCNLSKPWLDIEPNDSIDHSTIIINRTERSQNETINYSFLKSHEERLLFVGTHKEYVLFKEQFGLSLPCYVANNFLDLATVIRSCALFVGNQSFCYSLAEAMKVPRILEVCSYLPNVIPCGEYAFDFYFQSSFEWTFNYLANKFK